MSYFSYSIGTCSIFRSDRISSFYIVGWWVVILLNCKLITLKYCNTANIANTANTFNTFNTAKFRIFMSDLVFFWYIYKLLTKWNN